MRAAGVVEAYPVTDDTACVLQGLKAMTMRALLLERTDDPLGHAVLLWAMRRDELLAQAIAAYQCGIAARGKNQAVIRAQQERLGYATQRPEAGDQRRLQGCTSGTSLCNDPAKPA